MAFESIHYTINLNTISLFMVFNLLFMGFNDFDYVYINLLLV